MQELALEPEKAHFLLALEFLEQQSASLAVAQDCLALAASENQEPEDSLEEAMEDPSLDPERQDAKHWNC